jgi:hypothetical protein
VDSISHAAWGAYTRGLTAQFSPAEQHSNLQTSAGWSNDATPWQESVVAGEVGQERLGRRGFRTSLLLHPRSEATFKRFPSPITVYQREAHAEHAVS